VVVVELMEEMDKALIRGMRVFEVVDFDLDLRGD